MGPRQTAFLRAREIERRALAHVWAVNPDADVFWFSADSPSARTICGHLVRHGMLASAYDAGEHQRIYRLRQEAVEIMRDGSLSSMRRADPGALWEPFWGNQ